MSNIRVDKRMLRHIHSNILLQSGLTPWNDILDRREAEAFHKESRLTRRQHVKKIGYPVFLYKYFGATDKASQEDRCISLKKLSTIVLDSSLYLSSRDNFNDPYDVYPEYVADWGDTKSVIEFFKRNALAQGVSKTKVTSVAMSEFNALNNNLRLRESRIELAIKQSRAVESKTGIFCFSRKARSLPMWAHYADNHKGVCFAFDLSEDYIVATKIFPVQYGPDRPVVDIFKQGDYVGKALLMKHEDWGYEAESRLITPKYPGACMEFRPSFLAGVILGMRCSDVTKNDVFDLIQQRVDKGLSRLPVFRSYLRDGDMKYRIRFERIG